MPELIGEVVTTAHKSGRAPAGQLTGKQAKFAALLTEGLSQSECYRRAYETHGWKATSIANAASDLARHPLVTARYQALMTEQGERAWHDAERCRDAIAHMAWDMVADADMSPTIRLRAADLLGRMSHVAAFLERSESVTVNLSAEDVKARIESMVKRIAK